MARYKHRLSKGWNKMVSQLSMTVKGSSPQLEIKNKENSNPIVSRFNGRWEINVSSYLCKDQ